MEAPHELPISNVSQKAANTIANKPKPMCHQCKSPVHDRNLCRLIEKQREQTKNTRINLGNKNNGANNSNLIATSTKITATTNLFKETKERQKLFSYPVRHVGGQTTPQRDAALEPMQTTNRLPGIEVRKASSLSKREPKKVIRTKFLKLQPKI